MDSDPNNNSDLAQQPGQPASSEPLAQPQVITPTQSQPSQPDVQGQPQPAQPPLAEPQPQQAPAPASDVSQPLVQPVAAAPQPPQPTVEPPSGTPVQYQSYSEMHQKKRTAPIIVIILAIMLAVAAGLVWFYKFKQPSAQTLYQAAYANSFSSVNKTKYLDLDIASDHIKMKGAALSDTNGSLHSGSFNFSVDDLIQNIPLHMNDDMIIITNDSHVDTYNKLDSFSSSNGAASQLLDKIFAKVKGKWIKTTTEADDNSGNTNSDASFVTEGPLAGLEISSAYAPYAKLSDSDKKIYINAIKSDHMLTIKDGVKDVSFKGQDSRMVNVSLNKSGLEKLNDNVSSQLSDKSQFRKLSQKYIDALFGEKDSLPAKIYLSKDKAQIIGIEYSIDFAKPITEKLFSTKMTEVDVTTSFSDSGNHKIEAPKHYTNG